MKVKLLKKLRKLAKETIVIQGELFRNDVRYKVFKNGTLSCQFNSKAQAIRFLNGERREYIRMLLDNMKEEKLNEELSKI